MCDGHKHGFVWVRRTVHTQAEARGGCRMSLPITLQFIPLRQDLSPTLELGWWPASPNHPPVSVLTPALYMTYNTHDMCTAYSIQYIWPHLFFHMSSGDFDLGPHAHPTNAFTCWTSLWINFFQNMARQNNKLNSQIEHQGSPILCVLIIFLHTILAQLLSRTRNFCTSWPPQLTYITLGH